MITNSAPRFVQHISFMRSSTSSYRRGTRRVNRNNAGIKKRLAIFSEENPDIEKLTIDDSAFDQLESELGNRSEMNNFHKRNVESMKKKADFMMMQRKYFKVKLPNFLTWAEKEQIRELHKNEPNFWTFDKLSQSFPATPLIIKKVVESAWKADSERIKKHDIKVSENWAKMRRGELKLDPTLEKYLNTFSSREQMQITSVYDDANVNMSTLSKSSEFSKIITNYRDKVHKLEESTKEENRSPEKYISDGKCLSANEIDKKLLTTASDLICNNYNGDKEKVDDKMITLKELRNKIKVEANRSSISELDQVILKGAVKGEVNSIMNVDNVDVEPSNNISKRESLPISQDRVTPTYSDEKIPMKVTVPDNMPKQSVYRVKDVYYDRNGYFLYRVPGMRGVVD